jgi:hypothetical protein
MLLIEKIGSMLQYLMKLVTLVQVGGLSNTKKSVQPSTLATSADINVYLLNGHSSFSDADVEAVKVGAF